MIHSYEIGAVMRTEHDPHNLDHDKRMRIAHYIAHALSQRAHDVLPDGAVLRAITARDQSHDPFYQFGVVATIVRGDQPLTEPDLLPVVYGVLFPDDDHMKRSTYSENGTDHQHTT